MTAVQAAHRSRHRRPPRPGRWPARLLVAVAVLVALAVVGALTGVPLGVGGRPRGEPVPADPEAAAVAAGRAFLDVYVDDDGRVVRRDEGGDTVSEGQAYALLIAVAAGDQTRFRAVWGWTRDHLQRPDRLLSWKWAGGAVVDANSATDADLDAARALVLAGRRFAAADLAAAGRELAAAVLGTETVPVGVARLPPGTPPPAPGAGIDGSGLVLTGGSWAGTTPARVNPSYFSPVAERLLGVETGDPRWAELSITQRALGWQLIGNGGLPPDWVSVDTAGTATAIPDPAGAPPRFGLDAARLPVRMAESCDPADRALAAELDGRLGAGPADGTVAGYALDGAPLVSWTHPVSLVAAAGAAAAAGRGEDADQRLADATRVAADNPSYYGAAWVALGRIMLDTRLLGGCG